MNCETNLNQMIDLKVKLEGDKSKIEDAARECREHHHQCEINIGILEQNNKSIEE